MSGAVKKFEWRNSKLLDFDKAASNRLIGSLGYIRAILDAAEPCIQRRIREAVRAERDRVRAEIYEEQESRI